MSLDMGLFFGLCLFIAFWAGTYFERCRCTRFINVVLSSMDSDMDGKVTAWFKYKSRESMK